MDFFDSKLEFEVDEFLNFMLGAHVRGYIIEFDSSEDVIKITRPSDNVGYKYRMDNDFRKDGMLYTLKDIKEEFEGLLKKRYRNEIIKGFSSKNQIKPFLTPLQELEVN